MTVYTIGYGGRGPDELLALLTRNGVRAVVDVRLRPDRASMGVWVKAKVADKGIERVLTSAGIAYRSLPELGNVFLDYPEWQGLYGQLLERAGDLLTGRLTGVAEPYCLLCAEKRAAECHRRQIAEFLAKTTGCAIAHLE